MSFANKIYNGFLGQRPQEYLFDGDGFVTGYSGTNKVKVLWGDVLNMKNILGYIILTTREGSYFIKSKNLSEPQKLFIKNNAKH